MKQCELCYKFMEIYRLRITEIEKSFKINARLRLFEYYLDFLSIKVTIY